MQVGQRPLPLTLDVERGTGSWRGIIRQGATILWGCGHHHRKADLALSCVRYHTGPYGRARAIIEQHERALEEWT